MDILYFKVFNNIYLNKKIYNFIKNSRIGYKSLKEFHSSIIFKDKRLLNLYFQSYLYNKTINNNDNNVFYNKLMLFFQSNLITYDMFIILYNDYLNCDFLESKYSNQLVIEWCLNLNIDGDKEEEEEEVDDGIIKILNYLINFHSFKFEFSEFNRYLSILLKNKTTNYKVLNYLINLYINQETNQNKIDITITNLIDATTATKTTERNLEFYKPLFQLYIKRNFNDNKRNKLICFILNYGCLEIAQLYCEKYSNNNNNNTQTFQYFELNQVKVSKDVRQLLINRIIAFSILIKNNIIKYHQDSSSILFNNFNYLNYISINDYLPFLKYCEDNNIIKRIENGNNIISETPNLETLKYLIENRNSFSPPLKFNTYNLLEYSTSVLFDFQIFKFIMDDYNIKNTFFNNNNNTFLQNSIINFKNLNFINTNFEIVKYLLDTLDNVNLYQFKDIALSNGYFGNLNFIKYLVDQYLNDSDGGDHGGGGGVGSINSIESKRKVILSYRTLNILCEKGYYNCVKYMIDQEPILKLGISRDAINDAIKSGSFEIVELLKNKEPTKPNEFKSLYESTIDYIFNNNRNDILFSLLNSIYSNILIEKIKLLGHSIPINMFK